MSELKTVFKGEMQLMNWGESSSNGAWVKFWITPEDLEAFRHLKTRSGRIAGHRVMAVMVEIGEGEEPVQQEKTKVGARCIEASSLCQRVQFQLYVAEKTDSSECSEALAKDYLLMQCGCPGGSRKELDANDAAWDMFVRLVRTPYLQWLRERGNV